MNYGSLGAQQDQIVQNNGEPSLLTQEENDALQPKDVKVENPWIYEQTHQEYLQNIKVSVNRQVSTKLLLHA